MADYWKRHKIELTRPRAYRKNDQAWVEQKNGSVIGRLVGYGGLAGIVAAQVLAELRDAQAEMPRLSSACYSTARHRQLRSVLDPPGFEEAFLDGMLIT